MSAASARWKMVAAAGLLAVTVAAGWHIHMTSGVQPLQVAQAGYRELVNRALAGHLAWVAPKPGGEDEDELLGGDAAEPADPATEPPEPEVELLRDGLSPAQAAFAARSFLLDDIEHPERFSRLPDGSARLLPGFRRRPLPFSDLSGWHGRLLLREAASVPVLRSDAGWELRLVPGTGDLAHPVAVPPGGPPSPADAVRTGSSFSWSWGGKPALVVTAVAGPEGRTSVFLRRPRDSIGTLLLDGVEPHSPELLRPLRPGDWVRLQAPGFDVTLRLRQGWSGVLSDWRRGREGWNRRFLPSNGLDWLARSLAGSLDGAVRLLAEAAARNRPPGTVGGPGSRADTARRELAERDLVLAIDGDVQAAAQRLLDTEVHRRMPPGGWTLHHRPRLPPRAAAVVLSLDGEVLAAASYPREEQLEEHLAALRAGAGAEQPRELVAWLEREAGRRRHRVLGHHAFDAHQVGSLVKPVFASAVALSWHPGDPPPDPLKMHVACSGNQRPGPDGRPLPVGPDAIPLGDFLDAHHGPDVGFRDFLAHSCQTFMFNLGARALSRTPHFRVEDCDGGLDAPLALIDPRPPSTPEQAAHLGPLARYAWLTGSTLKDPETTGPDLWDHTWWAPLDSELREAVTEQAGCPLQVATSLAGVSPLRVNLDAGSLHACDPDFTSFLKGGATNRWSSLGIALAYARMITGRGLRGRLLAREEPLQSFDPQDCSTSLACDAPERFAKVRREVLAGMSMGLAAGTSRRLRHVVSRLLDELEERTGSRFGAYAKTGSSLRDAVVVTATDGALEPTRRIRVRIPVANFALAIARCAEKPGAARKLGPLACDRLPPPGEPVQGWVLELWMDGVSSDLAGGSQAGGLLHTAAGRDLLQRIAEIP